MDMSKTGFGMVCVVAAIGFSTPALATEQVYHPISPALGGNPNNGAFLLSTAQSQGEGVKSGNQGPTINFPPIDTGAGSGNNGTNGGGGTANGNTGNPLSTFSGRY